VVTEIGAIHNYLQKILPTYILFAKIISWLPCSDIKIPPGCESSLFWYVTHSRLVVTDVSGQPIGFLYKRPSHFNMGPIGYL
jgi:hypothetical protein